jgi:hypothetical protein
VPFSPLRTWAPIFSAWRKVSQLWAVKTLGDGAPEDQDIDAAVGTAGGRVARQAAPQILCRLTDQPGDFAVKFCQGQTSQPVLPAIVYTETTRWLARLLASRSVVNWGFHRIAGSAMR